MLAIAYPHIDPIAIALGPVVIRWYAIAYIAGLVLGWRYVKFMSARPPHAMREPDVDDFLVWATLGVVLGGRLGYVLFYKPLYYLNHPAEIFMLWQGGMAFHGGALGVILAIIVFARRRGLSILAVGDVICAAVPIGLFFGRIANFINGELFGRVAPDVPWAMIFPGGGPDPRHPSQLYQAGLEGLALFVVLHLIWRNRSLRERKGTISGAFLMGYGIARIIGELFRQPDAHLGFLVGGATMGQLLSLPLVAVGAGLMWFAGRTGRRI
ncbi:prolipoprotein diacylglyceryl transferase [Magnetospirillum sp. UT-4]|uniref:prolipoprotein diacylglyceryl transferase n=1 Tax=Magnetospirillum sp. UT-4 TaxID=2681467 RepID=UPI0013846314|nr:prolipoprotein diacylglyceryl transferase [Magnetospirillum sp. UT-4]CAA7623561.1 Prolipoprotein diacylglyceryl transferase [Magnetospirillum sp. UT-4]